MARYGMNEIRKGLKVLIDDEPCVIINADFRKPGKGQPTAYLLCKNLRTGRTVEVVMKPSATLEEAGVVERSMQYLHRDDTFWHFMAPDTHEQAAADAAVIGQARQWLKGNELCTVTLWNDSALLVAAPTFVELAVVETEAGHRSNTIGGGDKPAKFETGPIVRVPLFVQPGDTIRVDTRIGEYVSRVK